MGVPPKGQFFGVKLRKNNARLAQSVERKALNLVVVGSSPTVGAFRNLPQTKYLASVSTSGNVPRWACWRKCW